MEVKTGEMDAALENVYGNSISQDEVSGLLQEIQAESAMAQGNMGAIGTGNVANSAAAKNDVDQMQSKLDELKNLWDKKSMNFLD